MTVRISCRSRVRAYKNEINIVEQWRIEKKKDRRTGGGKRQQDRKRQHDREIEKQRDKK